MKRTSILLIFISLLLMIGIASAAPPQWVNGYQYRQLASISNTNSADLTNYQVKINIQGNEPTAPNYIDFSKVKSDGSDIYITDSSGTLMSYYVQSWDTTHKIGVVWANVTSITKNTTAGIYHFATTQANHDNYGLSYPLTYEFSIPASSSGLKAYKSYSGSAYTQITEKTTSDFFNAIEAVRFDYTNNTAYVSVAFDANSNDIYLKVVDSGNNSVGVFQKIDKYYDNRTCACVISPDDWGDFSASYTTFETACINLHIVNSPAIITNYNNTPTNRAVWNEIQADVNTGYVEPVSHSRTHNYSLGQPGYSYDSEIAGSKADILSNLTMPSVNRKGSKQYLYTFVAPGGQIDQTMTNTCAQNNYLNIRTTSQQIGFLSPYNETLGMYNTVYPTAEADDHSVNSVYPVYPGNSVLNATFDQVMNSNGVYVLYFHPSSTNLTNVTQHLTYLANRNNVWYVGYGQIYLYDYSRQYVSQKIDNSGNNNVYVYYGNQNAVSSSNYSNVFKKTNNIDGLVGLYHLDDVGDGVSKANDSSIYGVTAVWNSPRTKTTTDLAYQTGGSSTLDGTGNNSIDCGNLPQYNFTTAFTVNAWTKFMGANTSSTDVIVSKGKVDVSSPYDGWYIDYKANSQAYYFRLSNSTTSSSDYLVYWYSSYNQTYNYTHMATASFNNGVMKFYLDGVPVVTKTSTITNINNTGGNLKFGIHSGFNGDYWNGTIDEVSLYNRSLTDEEIMSLYNHNQYASSQPSVYSSARQTINSEIYTGVTNIVNSTGYVSYTQNPSTSPVDFSVTPSSDNISVTISKFNDTGDYKKTWNESSSNHTVTVSHTIGGFPANTMVRIVCDGSLYTSATSDFFGQISWVYSGGYSDHTFDAIPDASSIKATVSLKTPASSDNLKTININSTSIVTGTTSSLFGSVLSSIGGGYSLLALCVIILGAVGILRYLGYM